MPTEEERSKIKNRTRSLFLHKRHSEKDNWKSWKEDIEDAEKILIYKYSPNYNSRELGRVPELHHQKVQLVHRGEKGRLKNKGIPTDYLE